MMISRSRYAFRSLTSALLVSSSRCFSSITAMPNMKIAIPQENIEAISNLEPAALWSQFATISSIPRPSKQEDAVLNYIKSFAEERDLQWKEDDAGNLVVFHPGSGKGKNAPSVILQGHVDMVTEKNNDIHHDFENDPILLRRFRKNGERENWIGAKGTTLGADNGIGVAAALALLEFPANDDSTTLPPLEALFTVDEETGLTGAAQLDAKALGLTGTTMLNLDMEEWGELYVGCAGGGESTIRFPFSRNSVTPSNDEGMQLVEIRVEGLMGGHSGLNIHEGRANAILLCAATVRTALEDHKGVISLVSIVGGDKHNAIPREAKAVLTASGPEGLAAIEQAVEQCTNAAQAEYGRLETSLRISTKVLDDETDKDEQNCIPKSQPLDHDSATRLLSMLLALPHGPLKFSHAVPDLVETSNNVASITMSANDDTAIVLCSTRSSIGTALESARNKLAAVASLAGATITRSEPYPGWNPNLESPVLQVAKKLLSEKYLPRQEGTTSTNTSPAVKAVHAGLECGLLIEKMGGNVDALSFGPTIEGAHSPDERIRTDTVLPFFDLLKDILVELASKE